MASVSAGDRTAADDRRSTSATTNDTAAATTTMIDVLTFSKTRPPGVHPVAHIFIPLLSHQARCDSRGMKMCAAGWTPGGRVLEKVRTSIMVLVAAAVSLVVALVLRRSSAGVRSPAEPLAIWG